MTQNPSKRHSNKKPINWLIYKIGDRFLLKYSYLFKGVLYDLGCGESPYKSFFLQFADKYVGVDWSESMHDFTADIRADLNKTLPIDDECADTIVSLSVIEHLSDPQTMLNEAYRILKKDGGIFLQVPWQWKVHEEPHDYFRFSPYGLKMMFEKAGFVGVAVIPSSGFFTMWVLKFNYFSNTLIRGPKLIRGLIKLLLLPIWYINQTIAPILDKLDKNWMLETSGYYVIAKKNKINK